mmetsp:Transcript_54501/g.108192  ORF Transcript_54501/g.108192 Transcript_54501/m.108192 type:complete len:156 (+) Transcript_54501:45-512(+)
MKVIAAIALLFASATAFSPAVMRSQNSVAMSAETDSRRAMLGKTAGALGLAFSGASAAVADGSVSKTTVARARGKYGFRILALQDAVAKGDLASIAEEENAFKLFVSGAYTQKGAAVVKVCRSYVTLLNACPHLVKCVCPSYLSIAPLHLISSPN